MLKDTNRDEIVNTLISHLLDCRKAFVAIRDDLRVEGHAYTPAYTKAETTIMRLDKTLRDGGYERILLQSATGGGSPFPTSKA